MCGFDALPDQCIGNRLTGRIAGVTFEPVGIVEQAVAKHGLGFGIGHRCRCKFLRETRRVLRDIGEMRRMAAFVKQRVDCPCTTAHLVRLGFCREVDLPGDPMLVAIEKTGNRAVTKTVLIFAFALQQIKLQRRTAIRNPQTAEAFNPALQTFGERQIRVELAGDVTADIEAKVPRLGCGGAMGFCQILHRPLVGGTGSRFKVVEYREQFFGRHLLVLAHLVFEIIGEALSAGKSVAFAHDVEKAVRQHPSLQTHQGVVGTFARCLIRIGAQISAQHGERGFFALPGFIDVMQRQILALGEEIGFHIDQLAHQGTRFIAINDVAFKQCQPAFQTVLQTFLVGRIRHFFKCCQGLADASEPGRIGDKCLIGLLRFGESGVIVGESHVGAPEQVFLGFVDGEVFLVKRFKKLAGCSHGGFQT